MLQIFNSKSTQFREYEIAVFLDIYLKVSPDTKYYYYCSLVTITIYYTYYPGTKPEGCP